MVPLQRDVLEREPPVVRLRIGVDQEALEQGVEARQQEREVGDAVGEQLPPSDRGAAGSGQTHHVRVGLVIDAAVLRREAYLQRHLSGPYFGLQRSKDGRAAQLQTWSCGQRGGCHEVGLNVEQ